MRGGEAAGGASFWQVNSASDEWHIDGIAFGIGESTQKPVRVSSVILLYRGCGAVPRR